ncbi:putative sodium-coupled neutral amino acid transporter 10 [Bienertia sinuspersici]
MASNLWEMGSLKFWHGGKFSADMKGGIVYVGGEAKTHDVQVDELCYWDVINLAKALDTEGLDNISEGLENLTNSSNSSGSDDSKDSLYRPDGGIESEDELDNVNDEFVDEESYELEDESGAGEEDESGAGYIRHKEAAEGKLPVQQAKLKEAVTETHVEEMMGSFIVKKVVNEHRCEKNMKKNRQLTSMWAAKEMLEVFKARPHCPAEEIKETIKRAYKAMVTRNFAYKVKYKAHKLLHGSMQDHYNKVYRYIAAMKANSPDIVLDLVVDAETFNGYIINARTQHLLYMMEEIRGALMKRVCTKKQQMEKGTPLICPRIQAMLDKEKDKACFCDEGTQQKGLYTQGNYSASRTSSKEGQRQAKEYPVPQPEVGTPNEPLQPSHYSMSAQPSQLGRGGRMILGGVGARGRGMEWVLLGVEEVLVQAEVLLLGEEEMVGAEEEEEIRYQLELLMVEEDKGRSIYAHNQAKPPQFCTMLDNVL